MLPTTTETTYPTLFKKFVGSGLNQWPPAKKICAYSIELLNLEAVAFVHHEEQFAKKNRGTVLLPKRSQKHLNSLLPIGSQK